MATIKSYQEQVQEVVAKAIDAVEEQYKALSQASFGYAEKVYKGEKVETVKSKHDEYVALASGKARDVNKLVGDYVSELIAKFEKEAPKKKPAAKKPAAKKAPAKRAPAKKAAAAPAA